MHDVGELAPCSDRYTAGELAWCLIVLCETGIRFRQDAWCLGDPRPEEVAVTERVLVFTTLGLLRAGRATASRRHAVHLGKGHGEACRVIGVSREVIDRALTAWGDDGASELLLESFDAAVAELAVDLAHGEWDEQRAREVIAHAVCVRITPRMPAQERTLVATAGLEDKTGRVLREGSARPVKNGMRRS